MDKTHVVMLLDESGSMHPHREKVVSSFNEYVNKLKVDSPRTYLSLYKFDLGHFGTPVVLGGTGGTVRAGGWGGSSENDILQGDILRSVFINRKVNDVYELSIEQYAPRGMTPLLDATAQLIDLTAERLPAKAKVLFVVHTDGEENSSKTFTFERLKEKVGLMEEKHGWTFVYLGEGPSAWNVGYQFGIHNVSNLTSKTRGQTFDTLASATSNYAQSTTVGGAMGSTQTLYEDAGVSADHTGGAADKS